MQESTLADRLRKLRGSDSRRAFSLKYGIHEQSLIRYEKGIRIPDNDIIRRIADGEKVPFDWLRSGEGSMCAEEDSAGGKTGDVSPVLPAPLPIQPIENITSEKNKTGDMSPVLEIQRELTDVLKKGMAAQERIVELTEQLGELRLQLQARDIRIRELERENAELREANKGATHYGYGMAGA